ncbi:alginate export family protein [Novosphingobium lindaniclasticum]|uniref:Alginate export domain-containing protein n=1 Tax=Novosphingobium lindaniclasticum LE124 TaxID=1096930 RepID=T0H7F0_9SPHN|nr:alginate export family protein [Novosphingobium lindaniclasticum]EQB08028.1 hypothetical protein L284_22150 [Novosphingobium lindaniclasticum LE124]
MRNRTFPLRDRSLAGCVTIGLLVPGCAFAAAGDDAQPLPAPPAAVPTPQLAPPPYPAPGHAPAPDLGPASGSNPRSTPRDPLKSPFPAEADGQGPRTGPNYMMLRGAEDWRFLRDRRAKRDWASPLKFIPLSDDGNVSLTLNGTQRSSVSLSTLPLLSDTRDRIEVLSRTAIGADLRIGPAVRFYGELASGQIFGRNETRHIAIQKNDLIVQQLFAEVRAPFGSGPGAGVARVTVGRQEFFDGPRFIISPRENPNIRVSMNGARLSMDWRRFRFSAFHFEPTAQGIGLLDDRIGNGETLSGVYSSFVVAGADPKSKSAVYFDPFYYHFVKDEHTLGRLSGKDRRETYGARLWGRLGRVAFDWSALKQDGRFGVRQVDAWALSTNQSVGLGAGSSAPRLGFHADYASGGGTFEGSGKVGAFNFLYNATVIFSDDNYLGAINLMGIAPTLTVPLSRKFSLTGEIGSYWRPDRNDAVYRGNSQIYAGTRNVRGRHVANMARLRANWTPDPHVILSGIVNYAEAGKVLRRAGYGDNLFVQTNMTLRF